MPSAERGILKFEGECWCAAGGIMMAERRVILSTEGGITIANEEY
jgi:hypothetical protein